MSFDYTDQLLIVLDVLIASALTFIVGVEREKEDKPAGMRTNMIVGGSSCLLMSLTGPLIEFLDQLSSPIMNADPVRVLNALIVGISFVGAGTILKLTDKQEVKGLTTAATLLYSSGIGIAVALKLYVVAGCVTALTIVVNHLLPRIFDGLKSR
jgi:putative Mg2+ transporter-C (MgtC) family protein